ncbi:expressed unknown protein [Seminavis robusta]|uniref:Uncharacterized protein n=1 Tax=Seminavis robusta TaxID=568900 RepID=A0A9N8HD09_9STRA|nr:expressed unknown protein [Seminavis robusta]|eukprot:Sro324_g117460.1 n/a (1062) ;mRNA; f:6315-9500
MRALVFLFLCQLLSGAFAVNKEKALRKHKIPRTLTGELIFEVDEYECSDQSDDFSSYVLIDFHKDISAVTSDELSALAEAFQNTYAEVSFALCDIPAFRTISDASIDTIYEDNEIYPYEYTNSFFKKTNLTHLLKVDVHAECRECEDQVIFDGKGLESENSPNLEEVDSITVTTKTADGVELLEVKTSKKSSVTETCVCPKGTEPEFRAPTETEFSQIFAESVASLNSEVLGDMFDLHEVEEVDCSRDVSDFSSVVYVRLDGEDLSTLTEDEIVAMEEGFMATYNELNYAFCDYPHFRTIKNVTLDRASIENAKRKQRRQRLLQNVTEIDANETAVNETMATDAPEEETIPLEASVALDFQENVLLIDPPFDANILRFLIEATCRDCDEDTALFSFGTNETSSPEMVASYFHPGRSNFLQGGSGTCYCPSHPDPLQRAPTTEEFQYAFNFTLSALKAGDIFEEVDTLEDVLEVSELDCEANGTQFTSTVFVTLDMPLSSLSDFEQFTVEDAFRQSYNALSFSTCDEVFREVSDVRIVPTTGRRRELEEARRTQSNETASNVTVEEQYPAVFSVLGTCRGCMVDDNGYFALFDDVFRRERYLEEGIPKNSIIFGQSAAPKFDFGRSLKESEENRFEVCACPADVPNDGSAAPTADEFLLIFNDRLVQLEEAGVIGNFATIEDVVEAAEVCDGGTFLAVVDRYELGFTGDVDAVSDDVLEYSFRVAYNAQRQENCDPLVASSDVVTRGGVYVAQTRQDSGSSVSSVRLFADTLQIEEGTIFIDDATLDRFIANYNSLLASGGYTARLVAAFLNPSDAPSMSPSDVPSLTPSASPSQFPSRTPSVSPSSSPSSKPSRSPSSTPSSSPSISPSKRPSIQPSLTPSIRPTNNQAMCNDKVTRLSDYILIDYSLARIADINMDINLNLPDVWPLEDPATLIAAEEFIAAYNRLQGRVFCDPFERKMVTVTCVSTVNNILSGTLCCEVNFKCRGNCEEFIFPDRDPIGAFYDQPGFEYPTDGSCTCDRSAPDRAPSATEHFARINEAVPLEILSFEFRGFSASECPRN